MPYKQIHWVKLEKRLLNDPRFFTMSPDAQLLYVKILLALANFWGKMKADWKVLGQVCRSSRTPDEIKSDFMEIKRNFPKVLLKNGYITIKEFKSKHNWIENRELPRNSHGIPKEVIERRKKKEDKKEEYIRKPSFLETIKTNDAYKHINIDIEVGKMKAWLALPRNKGRQLTDRFILNWLNKIERPVEVPQKEKPKTVIKTEQPTGPLVDPKVLHQQVKELTKKLGSNVPIQSTKI